MKVFYVYYDNTERMFHDLEEAEIFAEEVDGILSDAWGDPIC